MAYKKYKCKILWKDKNKVAFDFNGNGHIILLDKEIDEDIKFINVRFDKKDNVFKI